jgi:hypothetical protein
VIVIVKVDGLRPGTWTRLRRDFGEPAAPEVGGRAFGAIR